MPKSGAVSAGDHGVHTQYNNLRDDALGLVEVTSGGAFSASRVLIETSAGFVLFDDTLEAESPQFVFSAEAATGAAETVDVYKPGSVIGGFSGMTPGTPYYSNSSGTLTTTAYLVRIVMARAISATEMIFNPEVSSFQITSGTFTGAAANRSDMVYLTSAGGWDRLTSSTPNVGQELIVGQLLKTVASPGTVVAVALSNQVISGFFSVRGQTLVAGTIYYASTSGAISSTKSGSAPIVGIGKTADELFLFPGDRRDSIVVETILSGENWSAGQVLYQSRSDGLYYRSDSDVAESGICERPAVAITTHTGGASNSQQVYLPGSTILGIFGGFSAGWRLYTSSTTGSFAANSPVSYDTFYRVLGHCPSAGVVRLDPQEMIFLPTGVQEKGYCGAGDYTANPAFTKTSMGVNFKKIMVNTPSSITLTATSSLYAATPTANNITRFGFRFNVTESANPNNAETWWAGTYQTVGN